MSEKLSEKQLMLKSPGFGTGSSTTPPTPAASRVRPGVAFAFAPRLRRTQERSGTLPGNLAERM